MEIQRLKPVLQRIKTYKKDLANKKIDLENAGKVVETNRTALTEAIAAYEQAKIKVADIGDELTELQTLLDQAGMEQECRRCGGSPC